MECPSCGAPISDERTTFCPSCSAPLPEEATEPTTRLDSLGPNESPSHLSTRLDELRTKLEASPLVDGTSAAALGFLGVVAVGGVLVLAAKLHFPEMGAGSGIYAGLNAFVIAGLAALGVPALLDGIGVEVLPLGALLACGIAIMWATRNAFSERAPEGRPAVLDGILVGVPFGLQCWAAALLFRFRGDHPVSSDAGQALLVGAFWGTAFASLELAGKGGSMRERLVGAARVVRQRSGGSSEGLICGAVTIAFSMLLGLAGVLLWIIFALASGAGERDLGAGDAVAYLVYLLAFLPNLVVAIIALGFGAPISVGARVDLGGEVVGRLRDYSLLAWDRGEAPALSFLLFLIPVIACVGGGFLARRRAVSATSMLPTLLMSSGVFSILVTLIAAIGPIRVAGLTRAAGYATVAPDLPLLFLLSFLASGVLGFAGWKLAENNKLLSARVPQIR